ncbi:MAG: class I SAM-dependent methyltransferase [Acidobacteria bacterium]|nr:class I SAM-dependent methyltransferase [Acidobacteriota bacterium]
MTLPRPFVAAAACSLLTVLPAAQTPPHGRLFPPEDLVILESPDREAWQQPERIMDALRIADGFHVADIGAGGGWFTIRLARRVGPNGRVYAEDVQPQMIDSIQRRVSEGEGLRNVTTVLGTMDDPRLPTGLDAVLMVDTYSQLRNAVNLLEHINEALAPNGLLGVVDFKNDGAGGPGPAPEERVDPDVVRRDAAAAGLVFKSHETFLRYQYLLVFGKGPATSRSPKPAAR